MHSTGALERAYHKHNSTTVESGVNQGLEVRVMVELRARVLAYLLRRLSTLGRVVSGAGQGAHTSRKWQDLCGGRSRAGDIEC